MKEDFQLGDEVYVSDWAFGVIVGMYDDYASVKLQSYNEGGSLPFDYKELTLINRY